MKIFLLFIYLLILPIWLFGQQQSYTTQRITDKSPVIDGIMDDESWDIVEWGGDFIQQEPYEGKAPSQPTSFKILYDDNFLYVGVMAYDSAPSQIVKRMSRRDGFDGDFVEINIDSHFDKMTAYSFTVTAAGVKGDEMVTEDGDNWDDTWDPIWYTKTSINDSGWVAEMKIPFTQLRFGKKNIHTWGIQFSRRIYRNEERSLWQFIPREENGWVSKFGELQGIIGIKPKRQVDLVPYLVAKQEYLEKEEENPYATGKNSSLNVGLDGKIGVTNDLTLDFTINPDFGQVEADPSEVNLSAYETFFEEKRPFFIESNNIYNFQITGGGNPYASDNLFYSRRIGRSPHHYPDLENNEYADVPENTTILGAFKLSGKTKSGWSLGILESVTQREMAEISSEGNIREEEVEPLTNYFLARLEKDINKGNTVVGGMFTSTNRKIENPEIDYLPDNAYTGGLNFKHFWKDKAYMVAVRTVFSTVNGEQSSMVNLQESPVRYFQRPDAKYIAVDTNLTSMQGQGGTVEFAKTGGGHWRYLAWVTWRSPGLELNDVGYLRSSDEVQQVVWASYRIWEPVGIFRRINFNFNQWSGWDFGGRNTFYGLNTNFNTQLKNFWHVNAGINYDGPSLAKSDLRGGPSLRYDDGGNVWAGVFTDQRKKVSFGLYASRLIRFNNSGTFNSLSFEVNYRPSDRLKIAIEPFYNKNYYNLQYIETADFDAHDRYITGYIDQKTIGLVGRLDFNISPDFTIQYYGQPFISNGKYKDFNRITDPQANDYNERFQVFDENQISYNEADEVFNIDENTDGVTDYSFDNPNYDFLQFQSNLVLRWEYVPGSTLYVVWSQGRTDFNNRGQFDFNRNFNNMFEAHPHDVFLVKLSYRLGL